MTQPIINYEPATTQLRVEAALTKEIKASAKDIFPLACPVEELRWIPGWDYQLIYSQTGINESNCIFTEQLSGPHFFSKPLVTTWTTMEHDPKACRVFFHIQLGQMASILFRFTFREVGRNVSSCTWQMVFTALDKKTSTMDKDEIKGKLELMMLFLAECLTHYCENGEMLNADIA